jgi:hypothetical protein
MVWFLNDRVLGREIWASRYTKWRTTADGAPVRQTLEISAVKGLRRRHRRPMALSEE